MEKINIVILDAYVANPGDMCWDGLANVGHLTIYDRTAPADVIAHAKDADAVIINKVVMSKDVIAALPRLKYIGLLATGYNNVDIEACKEHGITVCNVPSYSTDSVAQTVFAHLLNITNRTGRYAEEVRAGRWQKCEDFSFSLGAEPELAGLKMGIYGLGHIGKRVARIASAFGMEVISPTSQPQDSLPAYIEKVSFDEFLSGSDVISVNSPLTDSNLHIFNAENFGKMKDGVIFINTARGALVDEGALAEALRSGKVGAAGLDVLNEEPPRKGSPVIDAPNCYITPHIAWQSTAARRRLIDITADNLRLWLKGTPQNVVG